MNLQNMTAVIEDGKVTLTFTNAAEADDPNPVAFQPSKTVSVTLDGTVSDIVPIVAPELHDEPETPEG